MKPVLFKKADIALVLLLVITTLAGVFMLPGKSEGRSVSISCDGVVLKSFSLSKDISYNIETQYGYNTLKIEGGQVWVEDADCKSRDCIKLGAISKSGQIIVCLPHKLVIKIEGGEATDAISY